MLLRQTKKRVTHVMTCSLSKLVGFLFTNMCFPSKNGPHHFGAGQKSAGETLFQLPVFSEATNDGFQIAKNGQGQR